MKTAVINIKTDLLVKRKAQKVAEELGLSLSGVINGFLRHLVKTKTITFTARPIEEPTEYLLQALKESEQDIKTGKIYSFKKSSEAISFLDEIIKENEN